MEQQSWLSRRADDYKDNPKVRSLAVMLAGLVPVVGPALTGLDSATVAIISHQQEDRLWALCEELDRLETPITENMRSERFIHNASAVARASLITWRHEKIRLFARLLDSSTQDWGSSQDKFEEYFELVVTMSTREIRVLLLLRDMELKNPNQMIDTSEGPKRESDHNRTERFWSQFIERTVAECGVSRDEFSGFMNRLNRTGLFKTFGGAILGGDIDNGRLTPMFGEFSRWLQAEVSERQEQQPASAPQS